MYYYIPEVFFDGIICFRSFQEEQFETRETIIKGRRVTAIIPLWHQSLEWQLFEFGSDDSSFDKQYIRKIITKWQSSKNPQPSLSGGEPKFSSKVIFRSLVEGLGLTISKSVVFYIYLE